MNISERFFLTIQKLGFLFDFILCVYNHELICKGIEVENIFSIFYICVTKNSTPVHRIEVIKVIVVRLKKALVMYTNHQLQSLKCESLEKTRLHGSRHICSTYKH